LENRERLTNALSDRYRIEREIGEGGMATVYLAEDLKHHRQVALKVLKPELAAVLGPERFLSEIQTTAHLQHPNILPLFDSGQADGQLFYVMPCIKGESLNDRLNREGQLPVDEAVRMASEVAEALQAAHDDGVIHRDIKPANILLRKGKPLVADFGIALAMRAVGGERLTETGLSLGTPTYMSPEQAMGEREVDCRSDVYSLGAVLYEMLVGEPPHTGAKVEVVFAKLLTVEPVPPRVVRPAVPEQVSRTVLKALAKQPADRFDSMVDFAKALVAPSGPEGWEKSIVVLPFENLSPDPDNAFFADGLTEELIADLSKVKALRVISRTSAMMYKGVRKSAPTIAQELNVRYVLEGGVRRAGPSLRITAQLIDGATDTYVWAEKYGGTLEDVFDLQERLSRRIAEALKGALTPEEARRLQTHATDDPRVFEVWLRARQDGYRLTREGVEEAIRLTNQGLKIFGDQALLHAANGIFHYFAYDFGFDPTQGALDQCEASATRALEMDPDLPQALYARGLSRYKRGDSPAFVRDLRRAVELERASDFLWWLGFLLGEAGLTDEARGYADEAVERDPLLFWTGFSRAVVDLFDGRFARAIEGFRDFSSKGMADLAFAQWWIGQSLAYAGEESEAVKAFELGSESDLGLISDLCELGVRAFKGDGKGAHAWFETKDSLQQAVMRDETFPRYVAQCFARVGDFDGALRWVDQAIEWGFTNHRFLSEHDRFFVPLHGDSRFEDFMERAREKQRDFDA